MTAVESKPKRKPRIQSVKDSRPVFIGKYELAHHLQCAVGSINAWIADATIPPPHSRPGEKHPVWLRDHFDEYVRAGRWPRAAFDRKV